MKKFFLLLFLTALTGCVSVPIEEEIRQAKICVASHHDEKGVLTPAPNDYSTACWEEANRRIASQARIEKRREEAKRGKCRSGYMQYCDRWGDCGCVSNCDVNRILRGY